MSEICKSILEEKIVFFEIVLKITKKDDKAYGQILDKMQDLHNTILFIDGVIDKFSYKTDVAVELLEFQKYKKSMITFYKDDVDEMTECIKKICDATA